MPTEIERKFLMQNDDWKKDVVKVTQYKQAYLSRDKERTVRVRIAGDQGFITIKGKAPEGSPLETPEFEYQIPLKDAEDLLQICLPGEISKLRHIVMHDGHKWEIDVFQGRNAGLTMAEIELTSADEAFTHPEWLGMEVTDEPRYKNASLSVHPYSEWPENQKAPQLKP